MKLSEKSDQLLRAIRLTVKDEEFTAGELIARCAGLRAKECPHMAGAMSAAKFNAKRLGHWLKKHQGAVVDDWRLCVERGCRPHRKQRWVYCFESVSELGEIGVLLADAMECEARMDVARKPGSIRQLKQIREQFARIEDAERRGIIKPPTITRVDSTGRQIVEVMRDRNGEPLRDKAADPPAPGFEIFEIVATPKRAPAAKWTQPTRAELAGRHNQPAGGPRITFRNNDGTESEWAPAQTAEERLGFRLRAPYENADGGFYNPGGTVQQSISAEQSAGSNVRVCGRWPKYQG